jgi:signal transduction histidine kinase
MRATDAVAAMGTESVPAPDQVAASPGAPYAFVPYWSVRAKGLFVIGVLVVYAVLIAIFVLYEKKVLLADFEEIQQSQAIDGVLKQVDMAVFHSVVALFPSIDERDREAGMRSIVRHHQLLLNKHSELAARVPLYSVNLNAVNSALAEAQRNPSRANMNLLIQELVKIKNKLAYFSEQAQEKRAQLSRDYHLKSDSVAVTALVLVTIGLALLGTVTGLFFRRLTEDLQVLQTRALDIVAGYRGDPIPIQRHDEVGQLMMAVNNMASTLDKHEKDLMVERQKYFHQEKMAAIGALAAGVAHEIGNPIAAISGIAQEMTERRVARCQSPECETCKPDLIQVQIQRLAAITREISSFAAHQTVEPQLLDLNALLRSTSSLLRYDKRLRHVTLTLNLDDQLPAIYGVADQLTQVVMNLLINSMDALEGVTDRPRSITLTTRIENESAILTVHDNGHGMDQKTLGRAFEAFYTTKSAGKGTGLGLSLCYSIMEKNGGSISIESTPGVGTSVKVSFSLTEAAYNKVAS